MAKGTLYEVLGVVPQSESVVIQAAYKAMIKKYHPDIFAGDPAAAEEKAKELNHAFLILSDPERRASYDAELRRRRGEIVPNREQPRAAQRQGTFSGGGSHAIARRWPVGGWAGAILAIAVTGVVLYAGQDRTLPVETLPPASVSEPSPTVPPQLNQQEVSRGVREFRKLFSASGITGARAYSQSCVKRARQSQSWKEADFCFGFDAAASITDKREGTLPYTYFGKAATEKRLRAALVDGFGLAEETAMRRIDMIWKRSATILDEAPLPTPEEVGSGSDSFSGTGEIPAAFRGEWAIKPSECKANSPSRVIITSTEIALDRSRGRVDTVTPVNGDGKYVIRVTMAGDGEVWDDEFTLKGARGTDRLFLESDRGGDREYLRCSGA